MLEFEATVDGVYVDGIDMIARNEDGNITSFIVMIRPFKGGTAMAGIALAVSASLINRCAWWPNHLTGQALRATGHRRRSSSTRPAVAPRGIALAMHDAVTLEF